MKRRRLLIPGVLLAGLAVLPVWLSGLRVEHVGFLIRSLSEPPKLSVEETAELHRGLRESAIHLSSVEAGSGFDDMQPLRALIGDARVVALGEASHWNREFSQIKHRMVEFLVGEMGFTVFAIEATFAGALELNDYIQTGHGDPERALGALVYPAWNTQEMLALVNWMREHNATHEEKVKFYGLDNKPATGSARAVYEFLRRRDGARGYDELLSILSNPWTAQRVITGPKEEIHRLAAEVERLIAHLESRRSTRGQPAAVEQDPHLRRERSLVVQHARVLLQYLRHYGAPSISQASSLRDRSMAQNARWLMDYENGAKMILWAANSHISATPGGGSMGRHLRRMCGDDLAILGLICNRKSSGSASEELPSGGPQQASRAPAGSIEALLAEAGLELAVLDLRSLPQGVVSRYLKAPLPTENGATCLLPWAYDALLFVESTRGARPVRAGRLGGAVTRLPSPSNLDFEETEDGRPKDWRIQGGQSLAEYQTASSHDQPYEGSTSGRIRRAPGRPFGEAYGNLVQFIQAHDFRGKKIRFTAAVRVDDGIGYLWLSADVRGAPTLFRQQIITSNKWHRYSIVVEIPPAASAITYGLAYVGRGEAFIDDAEMAESD